MKKIITLILIAFICNGVFAQTQPVKKPAPKPKPKPAATSATPVLQQANPTPVEMQEQSMKAWEAYMTPGEMHKMMADCNGDWREDVTLWLAPDAPPSQNTASCTNTMIMDNRYQQSVTTGMMNGMPFEGRSLLAFDNAKKVFISTWIDNMGTGIMYLEGKWDEKERAIHFSGRMVDPMTGKDTKVREDFKLIDANNQLMEMYSTQNGKEYKSMEIRFSR